MEAILLKNERKDVIMIKLKPVKRFQKAKDTVVVTTYKR